ncbi:LysR family substrate-binding transcriptional regulator (fragment) [Xenorhabdus bovienii str. Intermedium]|uniref:LysR family substrate-binding transcriptional regulator n=1 Tax=Xenorhabdus bovienii str. Intermedium TaxID=1379677 RepID=A0A077QPE3_XENBV
MQVSLVRSSVSVLGVWKNLLAIRKAVLGGFGIAMVPRVMVCEDLQTGKLVEILKGYSGKVLGVYAVYPYTRNLPLKIRLLIEHIMISYKNISHYF